MNLYFVHAFENSDLDWFVVARSPEEALSLWRKEDFVQSFADDDETRVKVRLVPASPHHFVGTPKVIPWEDVKDVTP